MLYRNIESPIDCQILQDDLNSLSQWETDWQMKFNVAKCHSMRVTRHLPDKQILFDYVAFRADRKSKAVRSGGVFILVRDNLRVTEQPEFKADCELIWVKLEVTGSHPLYIGAYYKPHEEDLTSLTELRKSIEQVGKKNGNIWLLGDFNLPGLTWTDNIPLLKSTLSSKPVYEYFLDLINDFGLCQMVTEPTRHSPDNTLDLFLTSNPTLIQRVDILPGLGDPEKSTCLQRPTGKSSNLS